MDLGVDEFMGVLCPFLKMFLVNYVTKSNSVLRHEIVCLDFACLKAHTCGSSSHCNQSNCMRRTSQQILDSEPSLTQCSCTTLIIGCLGDFINSQLWPNQQINFDYPSVMEIPVVPNPKSLHAFTVVDYFVEFH